MGAPISFGMSSLRSCLALLLTLVMVLTAQGMVSARGHTGTDGQMVICTGAGPVVIYVDDQGNPTDAPRYCPDAVSTLLSPVAPPVQGENAPERIQSLEFARHSTTEVPQTLGRPHARGPPATS